MEGAGAPAIEAAGASQDLGKGPAGIGAAGEHMAVVAMRRDDMIALAEEVDRRRRGRFLADIDVEMASERLLRLQREHRLLEAANEQRSFEPAPGTIARGTHATLSDAGPRHSRCLARNGITAASKGAGSSILQQWPAPLMTACSAPAAREAVSLPPFIEPSCSPLTTRAGTRRPPSRGRISHCMRASKMRAMLLPESVSARSLNMPRSQRPRGVSGKPGAV